jgi:hypothetical protein
MKRLVFLVLILFVSVQAQTPFDGCAPKGKRKSSLQGNDDDGSERCGCASVEYAA